MNLPKTSIGNYEISRLICGGNPFAGGAHSGELKYVGRLFSQYFTDDKIIETLEVCVENGINTVLARADDHIMGVLNKYKHKNGSIQWIAQTAPERKPMEKNVEELANNDNKPICCFIQGGTAGEVYANNQMDKLGEWMELIRSYDIVPGIGAHNPNIVMEAEKNNYGAEFYMLTLNTVDYHCDDTELAAKVIKEVKKPVMAFKILGAGRIGPHDGFKYAIENIKPNDVIVVGMFDFQVEENVRLASELMHK